MNEGVRETLLLVREIITTRGWTRGRFTEWRYRGNNIEPGRVCLMAAINLATGTRLGAGDDHLGDSATPLRRWDVMRALRRNMTDGIGIIAWNDEYSRTRHDILRIIDKTLEGIE